MKRLSHLRSSSALLLTLTAIAAPSALALQQAGSHSEMPEPFFRGYFLEHEARDLPAALKMYQTVALSDEYTGSQRATAARYAAGVSEDLASEDLARLFPAKTLAYMELNQPGNRLAGLMDVLGLLQGEDGSLAGAFAGISPLLVESVFGVRGMAMGMTTFNFFNQKAGGVVILNPGNLDLVRGLIETTVPNSHEGVEDIGGHATYSLAGAGYLTITERLVIISTSTREIKGVIKRLEEGGKSFKDSPAMLATEDLRGQDLAFWCVNMEPLTPAISFGMNMAAKEEPALAAALNLWDVESVRACAGRIGLGSEGLGMDMVVQMKEGHSNKLYNLFRMPNLDAASLALVPEGAAFFLSTSFNESARGDVGTIDSLGRPVVSFMDIGRELFGNIVDVSLFAMPEVDFGGGSELDGRMAEVASMSNESQEDAGWQLPVPQAGLAMRVNDAERSKAMWDLVLSTMSLANGHAPEHFQLAGYGVTKYELEGMPVYVGSTDNELVITPSRIAVERSLVARATGFSIRNDDSFREAMAKFSDDKTMALFASPGRVAALASQVMPQADAEQVSHIGEVLGEAAIGLSFAHSETRLGMHMNIARVPNINDTVAQMLDPAMDLGLERLEGLAMSAARSARQASTPPAPAPVQRESYSSSDNSQFVKADSPQRESQPVAQWATVTSDGIQVSPTTKKLGTPEQLVLKASFEKQVQLDYNEASALGNELVSISATDANYLNEFATELLTQKRFGGHYDELALSAAEISNELGDHGVSGHVDILALAHFELGRVELAIELGELAVELAGKGGPPEALAKHLKMFEKAREEGERDRSDRFAKR